MNFDFKSIDEVNPSNGNVGSYGKFGLNSAKLEQFEYTDAGGSAGAQQDALLVTFKVNEAEYKYRIFPAKVFGTLDPNSEEYKQALEKAQTQVMTAVNQIAEAVVDNSLIATAMTAQKPTTFKEYVQIMERLIKNTANWNSKELDLFLNWQGKPGTNQNKTFLEVPRQTILNFSNSIFVTSKQVGAWTEDRAEGKLVFRNESGNLHPIKRDKWFMDTSYSKRIDLEKDNAPASTGSSPSTGEVKEDW